MQWRCNQSRILLETGINVAVPAPLLRKSAMDLSWNVRDIVNSSQETRISGFIFMTQKRIVASLFRQQEIYGLKKKYNGAKVA
jgi:hypothetical protein